MAENVRRESFIYQVNAGFFPARRAVPAGKLLRQVWFLRFFALFTFLRTASCSHPFQRVFFALSHYNDDAFTLDDDGFTMA